MVQNSVLLVSDFSHRSNSPVVLFVDSNSACDVAISAISMNKKLTGSASYAEKVARSRFKIGNFADLSVALRAAPRHVRGFIFGT